MNPSDFDSDSPEETLDRLDNLLSCYFDDELDEQSLQELNETLANDPEARRRYIESAQMHIDLVEHFRTEPDEKKRTPIAPLNLPTSLGGPSVESL